MQYHLVPSLRHTNLWQWRRYGRFRADDLENNFIRNVGPLSGNFFCDYTICGHAQGLVIQRYVAAISTSMCVRTAHTHHIQHQEGLHQFHVPAISGIVWSHNLPVSAVLAQQRNNVIYHARRVQSVLCFTKPRTEAQHLEQQSVVLHHLTYVFAQTSAHGNQVHQLSPTGDGIVVEVALEFDLHHTPRNTFSQYAWLWLFHHDRLRQRATTATSMCGGTPPLEDAILVAFFVRAIGMICPLDIGAMGRDCRDRFAERMRLTSVVTLRSQVVQRCPLV